MSRVVFTGSREYTGGLQAVYDILKRHGILAGYGWEIQHGGAKGFDSVVDNALRDFGLEYGIEVVKPDYKAYGPKYAPIARNREMVEWAAKGNEGMVIAMLDREFTPGKGGTATTVEYALGCGLDVHVYRFGRRSDDF